MTYTIIGAQGFVGNRVVQALRGRGDDIFAPTRNDPDIFSRNLGQVFYCAGLTADYAARPFDTVEAHVTLLSRILKEASFERLVYLSSTRLYDSLGKADAKEEDPLLLSPQNARHLYDLSKALGENLCLHFSGGRCSVARLSCVYDWQPDATGFLPELLRRADKEGAFLLDSATGFVRDYIHVDDVVQALVVILHGPPGQIVNVASGENVSNAEIVDVLNNGGWKIELARQSERQVAAVCDNDRLVSLGLTPRPLKLVLKTWIEARNGH